MFSNPIRRTSAASCLAALVMGAYAPGCFAASSSCDEPLIIYAVGQFGFDSELLFEINGVTGEILSQTQLTGIVGTNMPRALEFTPQGRLFAFTQQSDNRLYDINVDTAAATEIGQFNAPLFEGGLAIIDETNAYLSNVNTSNLNFLGLVDITDATFEQDIQLSYETNNVDLSGLSLRDDGMLIGFDSFGREVPQRLVTIDPSTGVVEPLVNIDSSLNGDTAGMSIHQGVGYFIYNRRQANILIDPRKSQLWSFDPFTGQQTFIAELDTNHQIHGIAIAPCNPICIADVTTDGGTNGMPDGVVTLSDFSFYLSLWSQGDDRADLTAEAICDPSTPDQLVTLSDFACYLSAWSEGCP
ncbi:MAG: GC-type dockerin domain-anchored protein [Planctomycetota bacterium]